MQQGMQSDQGSAFESTFSRHDSGSELKVTKCPYNDILQAEGKPQLLSVCCCSQDASWCAPARIFAAQSMWCIQQRSSASYPRAQQLSDCLLCATAQWGSVSACAARPNAHPGGWAEILGVQVQASSRPHDHVLIAPCCAQV